MLEFSSSFIYSKVRKFVRRVLSFISLTNNTAKKTEVQPDGKEEHCRWSFTNSIQDHTPRFPRNSLQHKWSRNPNQYGYLGLHSQLNSKRASLSLKEEYINPNL